MLLLLLLLFLLTPIYLIACEYISKMTVFFLSCCFYSDASFSVSLIIFSSLFPLNKSIWDDVPQRPYSLFHLIITVVFENYYLKSKRNETMFKTSFATYFLMNFDILEIPDCGFELKFIINFRAEYESGFLISIQKQLMLFIGEPKQIIFKKEKRINRCHQNILFIHPFDVNINEIRFTCSQLCIWNIVS